MRDTFDALCREAGARGPLAVLALLLRELVDVPRVRHILAAAACARSGRRLFRKLSALNPVNRGEILP